MGHVRKARSGRGWEARYRDPSGRERGRTFPRKVDADRFLATVRSDVDRGSWRDPALGRIRFEDWASEFMAGALHLRVSTRSLYEMLLTRYVLPEFGPTPLTAVRQADVRNWVGRLSASGLAPGTVIATYRVLSRIFRAAVESDMISRSPCTGVELPRSSSEEMHFLDPAEVERLADAINPRYRALVSTAAYTGLRWGELAGLRMKHLDLLHRRIFVLEILTEVDGAHSFGAPKTAASKRAVRFPAALADQFTAHLKAYGPSSPDGLVFTAAGGALLRRSNFRRSAWGPALKAAGLDPGVRVHDLRHTCAALLIAQGAHPKAIQARLGHSTIRVTLDRYGHLFPGLDDSLMDGLDQMMRGASRDFRGIGGDEQEPGQTKSPAEQGFYGGDDGTRTHDFLLAKQVL